MGNVKTHTIVENLSIHSDCGMKKRLRGLVFVPTSIVGEKIGAWKTTRILKIIEQMYDILELKAGDVDG